MFFKPIPVSHCGITPICYQHTENKGVYHPCYSWPMLSNTCYPRLTYWPTDLLTYWPTGCVYRNQSAYWPTDLLTYWLCLQEPVSLLTYWPTGCVSRNQPAYWPTGCVYRNQSAYWPTDLLVVFTGTSQPTDLLVVFTGTSQPTDLLVVFPGTSPPHTLPRTRGTWALHSPPWPGITGSNKSQLGFIFGGSNWVLSSSHLDFLFTRKFDQARHGHV